jgi:hypothetical protein
MWWGIVGELGITWTTGDFMNQKMYQEEDQAAG